MSGFNDRKSACFVPDVRQLRCDSGASAIEFAIVAPVFLALIFVLFVIALSFFDRQSLQFAVEQTGRQIAVAQHEPTQSELRVSIESRLNTIGSPAIDVTYATLIIDGVSVGHLSARMTRTYPVPFFSEHPVTHTADTYMPVAR